jgi:AcrR family transcriptional regulator/predicted DNA-binding transcriptional regulator AlpA
MKPFGISSSALSHHRKRDTKLKLKRAIPISELAQKTGLPASTIRFYVREGLIPQPVKTGQTRAYYSQEHLKAIQVIQKKKSAGKKSLHKIRMEVAKKIEKNCQAGETPIPFNPRDKIINSATELFSSKGYAETNIADIVDHAKMSKETFYLHFRSKEALFMECADKVFHEMYRDVWQQLRDEKDIAKRSAKRTTAFFASYPKWITMMNLVRALSVGNAAFKDKFKSLLRQMIDPIIKEQKRLKEQGIYSRDVDYDLSGYLSMGMAEYGALLISRGVTSENEVTDYIVRIVSQGLLNT